MMAPEATAEKPVDASVTAPALTPASEPESQNVDEIENKQIAEIVDELVNSAEVSVSGGSDTEASKAKSSDEKGHVRTSSTVNKPKSFKSVSVNRTFLAAKGAANATSRPESAGSTTSTTPTPTASTASKLKLVAKSNNNLSGSTKTLATNGKPTSAPDPNTVWNKNRPVPVPEPKKMTDEELQSKYGIHMADRLRPEDDRGQANWADIDDDEEWAPETITWTDGTKISLPQVDDNPPTPSQAPAVPAKETQIEKPKSPVASAPAEAKASPSIRPGVLASGKGLVLKGAQEKPTLVAKAPAPPTPAKSPWAPLPPVDKVSPVVMDIPTQQQQPPGSRGCPPRDMANTNNITPSPAKEIAADDFSRSSWKDNQAGNRELFNSHSGRYEPVHDRRGSRHDPRGQPALLQRHHQHDQQGPAEPSAAFQTSRSSGDAMPYGRRRGSSNVSGGSGSFVSRPGKLLDIPNPAEIQQPEGATSPSVSGSFSPAATHPTPRTHAAQPWQPRPSPGQTHAVPYENPAEVTSAPPQLPREDDIELQKKLMRERRELAIKRRMEEEAREEAARKERIRLKLEAMGPAPERKSSKKDDTKDAPTQIQQRDGIPAALMPKSKAPAEKSTTDTEPANSSTVMPDPNKSESQVNGAHHGHSQDRPQSGTSRPGPAVGGQTNSHWPGSHQTADGMASWSSASQGSTRNVWAAPGNDRTLGNGTFNSDLANLADSQPVQASDMTSRPAPIAPPRSASQGQNRPDTASNRLPPIGPPSRGAPSSGQRPASRNTWANADIAAEDRAIRLENQKRMEEQANKLSGQGLGLDDVQVPMRDTWRSVNLTSDGKRAKVTTVSATHGEPQEAEPSASWKAPENINVPPNVERHDATAPLHREHIQAGDYRQQPGPNGIRNEFGRQAPIGSTSTAAPGPVQGRGGSRFFPHSGPRDVRAEEGLVQPRSKSPTPPPPTMDDHPAYDGDAARPHVSLPPARPVVKLPPSAVRQQQAPVPVSVPVLSRPASFAAAVASGTPRPVQQATAGRAVSLGQHAAGPQRPTTTQESWQERINSLVGRGSRVSPGKPMTVDSASKSAFEYTQPHVSATVSLPSLSSAGSTTSEDSSYTSREMAEECFDEQEMGSLPLIRIPDQVPNNLHKPVEPNWGPLAMKLRVNSTTANTLEVPLENSHGRDVIRIHVEGMNEEKTVPVPAQLRSKSSTKRQGRNGGPRQPSRGGQRGWRDASSTFGDQNSAPSSNRLDRPSSNRGRGGFRARSENWSRVHAQAA